MYPDRLIVKALIIMIIRRLYTADRLPALRGALQFGQPEIFNTDEGAQFTAQPFIGCLETAGVRVSMDGRGRVMDNIFVARLWRTVKYEDIYLKEYATVPSLEDGLRSYFT